MCTCYSADMSIIVNCPGGFQKSYFVSGFENGKGVEQKSDPHPRCGSGNQVTGGRKAG